MLLYDIRLMICDICFFVYMCGELYDKSLFLDIIYMVINRSNRSIGRLMILELVLHLSLFLFWSTNVLHMV
jgi:hypothetical protein